jgi:spermidine/putrescine transport system ATP-binding protein
MSIADRLAILRDGQVEQVATPADGYYRPTNRFVAEFLGETNIIEGVARPNGGGFLVETPFGSLPLPHRDEGDGAAVTISVRPESWRIAKPDETHALRGTVRSTVFLGESTHVEASVDGRTILAMVHGRRGLTAIPPIGSPIALTADEDEIAVIRV